MGDDDHQELDMMTKDTCDTDLGELAAIYDKESKNTFVSLYYDGRDAKFLGRRRQAIHHFLSGEEQENFDQTMDQITRYLTENRLYDFALFASHKHDFFKVAPFTVHPVNSLIVDSSPYIRPLAEIADNYKPFILLLLNHNQAKIYTVTCGAIIHEEELSKEIMNKHKKGGWSQARFQRLRQGSIHAFFVEVLEELEKLPSDSIMIAGPGQAKHDFKKLLPSSLAHRLVGVLDADFQDHPTLFRDSQKVIREQEKKVHDDLLGQVKKEVLTDGLAVYGIEETKQALINGQVDVVMVEHGFRQKGWICEHCQIIERGSAKKCYNCGGDVSSVDVIEELVEMAHRMGARVDFIHSEEMEKYGHIAALLRYK